MTKFKNRLLSGLAAVTVLGTASIPAYAEGTYKLITISYEEISEILDCDQLVPLTYNGLTAIVEDNKITDVVAITDENLENWRTTGKFTVTEVDVDFDMDKYLSFYYASVNLDRDEVGDTEYVRFDHEESGKIYTVYDSTEQTLSKLGEYNSELVVATTDGYIVTADFSDGLITLNVKSPDGESETFFDKYSNDNIFRLKLCYSGDYLAYYMVDNGVVDNIECDHIIADVYAIDKNLNKIKLCTKEINIGLLSSGNNYYATATMTLPKYAFLIEYHANDGEASKTYSFDNYDIEYRDDSGRVWSFNRDTSTEINGTTAVMEFSSINSDGTDYDYLYSLVDISEGKRIGDMFSYISNFDENGYALVETTDGAWGFVNTEAELLATYDDAAIFNGSYTLVQNDGNAYLVDRNFNKVSEAIQAKTVQTTKIDGLYTVIDKDGNYSFATYKAPEAEQPSYEADTPVEAEPTLEAEPSVEAEPTLEAEPSVEAEPTLEAEPSVETPATDNTDSGKTSPDTGLPFMVSAPIALLAAGFAILSRKKN